MTDLALQPCWLRWRAGGRTGLHVSRVNIEVTIFHDGGQRVAFAEPMHSEVPKPLWKRLTRTVLTVDEVGDWGDWRVADPNTNENFIEARLLDQKAGLSDSLACTVEVNTGPRVIGRLLPGGHTSGRTLTTASGNEAVYTAESSRDRQSSPATVRAAAGASVAAVVATRDAPASLVPTDGEIYPLDSCFLPEPGADPDLVTLALLAVILDNHARHVSAGKWGDHLEVRTPDGVSKRDAREGERERNRTKTRERMIREHPQMREALERRERKGR